ncbi:unnamed protein product [Lactuca saligna]|uniref:Uncharacterized protein n=1 Tax=Lactuca saligna TaxID=75948 RepID=A0AA35ZI86_LACSI|nr:unnamed protein product [Lactuca saligna]
MDTNINLSDQKHTNIHEKAIVKPFGVLNTESGKEEIGTTDIAIDLSNKGTNVNMDEGMLNHESSVTSIIDTSTALPPPSLPGPTYIPVLTISPTFDGIMQEPITTLFSSQSTENSQPKNETNDEDIMVSFADLQFNPREENIPDELIMSDTRRKNYVTGVEMEYLIKSQESCLQNLIEGIEKKQVERLAFHSRSYDYEIHKFCDAAKARHELFMEHVNETNGSLVVKVDEIKSLMS